MSKSRKSSEANHDQDEPLAAAVRELTNQVEVLRQAIDEFREIFTWAVRSDRLRCGDRETPSLDSGNSAELSETEPDDEQHEGIVAAVQDCLNDVGGSLEEAVRDQLKRELAGFRDSLDQFSLDIQWAARQVRQATSDHRSEPSSSVPQPATTADDAPTEHRIPEPEPTNHRVPHTSPYDARQSLLWQPE